MCIVCTCTKVISYLEKYRGVRTECKVFVSSAHINFSGTDGCRKREAMKVDRRSSCNRSTTEIRE